MAKQKNFGSFLMKNLLTQLSVVMQPLSIFLHEKYKASHNMIASGISKGAPLDACFPSGDKTTWGPRPRPEWTQRY